MAARLRHFGWEPVVVTVHPKHYEEVLDPASLTLLPNDLVVEHAEAWPSRICRPLGFGDVSLRGQWRLREKIAQLVRRYDVKVIFATVLPGYTSLVGAWAKRKLRLPFVLDYQDPWVGGSSASAPTWSKARIAHRLACYLEPKVVPLADGLTAVSDETLDTLRERKLIGIRTQIEIIPIGADEGDHEHARLKGKSAIQKQSGLVHVAYVGTITHRMLPALRAFLLAAREVLAGGLPLRVHLIGTSAQPDGDDRLGVGRVVAEAGATAFVRLEPERIPYLDALRSMQQSDVLLLIGSMDSHYTASKIFPCWLARVPILALFHSRSTVNQLAAELGGVAVINYDETSGPETRVADVALALRRVIAHRGDAVPPRDEQAFALYSASGVGQRYAALFDRVCGIQRTSTDLV